MLKRGFTEEFVRIIKEDLNRHEWKILELTLKDEYNCFFEGISSDRYRVIMKILPSEDREEIVRVIIEALNDSNYHNIILTPIASFVTVNANQILEQIRSIEAIKPLINDVEDRKSRFSITEYLVYYLSVRLKILKGISKSAVLAMINSTEH